MNTIFVAIASYIDYEIKYTILDCISKAKHPENLYFSVCLQYDENEGTNEYCLDYLASRFNIKVIKYHHSESQGGCWARNLAQSAYNGEKFSLQIDSHTRFIQNWDEIVINDYNKLKETVNKPLLSYLPPLYSRMDDKGIDFDFRYFNELDKMSIPKFLSISSEYWPVYSGYETNQNINFQPVNTIALYGGFVFTDGNWVVDVKQDPEHYYTGEEFALTIRSFTHGYDIYTPSQIIIWHRLHSTFFLKHYTNNPEEIVMPLHRRAMERLQYLIEQNGDLGEYNIGSVRTIDQYAEFAGIDFKNKKIISV